MELKNYPRPKDDTGWGFHGSASSYHQPPDVPAFAKQLTDMGIRWYKTVVDGDNMEGKIHLVRDMSAAGIEVIVRLHRPTPHPNYVAKESVIRLYVDMGAHYFEYGNEPNLTNEWVPDREIAAQDLVNQFLLNKEVIEKAGGICLFPAMSPGGNVFHRDLFLDMLSLLNNYVGWHEGVAVAIHNRPLNHPPDMAVEPGGCTFSEYLWYGDVLQSMVGQRLPLIGTESGYEIGWAQDDRYPPIDESLHAQYSRDIFDGFRGIHSDYPNTHDDYLFCQCMWLADNFGHEPFRSAQWFKNPKLGRDLLAVNSVKQSWADKPFVRKFSWDTTSPPPPIPNVDEHAIRNAAWNMLYPLGVAYNPTAAFQRKARELGLGVPTTNEHDIDKYRFQGFAGSILYAIIGEWDNIIELEW